ncbi:MAG: hypothetical protein Kow0088_10340 [Anaerolineales bacterium]
MVEVIMRNSYSISDELIQQIIFHLHKHLPEEACGLLGGQGHTFQTWIPIDNILKSPVRYQMDAEGQLKAFLEFERNHQDLLGIVHSHPHGPATPSETDLTQAYYPEAVYFIFYPLNGEWHFNVFRITGHQYYPLEINIQK